MNILNRMHYQRGVGLLEVLIALVVIAVGVIAVLGLQGTLMSGSAATKARNEAVALAREKTEELRNAVERDQFVDGLSLVGLDSDPEHSPDADDGLFYFLDPDVGPDGKINGVNARFTRSWAIADVAGVKNTKELVMQVYWKDAQDVDNQVKLNTLITFASPLTSALNGYPAGGLSVGERDTGYEGLHPETPSDGYISSTYTPSENGLEDRLGITKILRYSNSGHVQVRIAHTEGDTCPHQDIVGSGTEAECVVFTAFGGTLLRFNGTLYLDEWNKAKNYTLLVKGTSAAYCAHTPEPAATCGKVKCVEYQCYASGDCTNGGETDSGCPATQTLIDAMNLPEDLNGGWHGRIGYFLYDENGGPFAAIPDLTICMGKSDDVNGILEDNVFVSRSYYSLRDVSREGINQSYSCHNTLLSGKTGSKACDNGYEKMITDGIVWNSFKDQEVIRYLDADTELDPNPNIVLGTEETYCNVVSVYGSVVSRLNNIPTAYISLKAPAYTVTMTTTSGSPGDAEQVKAEQLVACETQVVEEKVIDPVTLELIPTYIVNYACNYVGTSWAGNLNITGTGEVAIMVEVAGILQPVAYPTTCDSDPVTLGTYLSPVKKTKDLTCTVP